jgi:glycosyltransferase involved in cell wall biosynthesis
MKNPKVTVFCITYNQKKYIRQCLDSILLQKTDFEYEVLINDDASSDGTREIIEEYQKKYPGIVKPVFHEENQFSKGKRNFILRYLMPEALGKYLAICEGDDYWTDPNKLQKQVNFLDHHKDYAVCFHPVQVIYEDGDEETSIYPVENKPSRFTVNGLLRRNFMQTNSVMYRKQTYKEINTGVMPGDWYLHLYHAQYGKIGFVNEVMSVYRRHSGGLWWESDKNIDQIWIKHGVGHAALYAELLKLYGSNNIRREIIITSIYSLLEKLSLVDGTYKTSLIREVARLYPDAIEAFAIKQRKEIDKKDEIVLQKEDKIQELESIIRQRDDELELIKSSKLWKVRDAYHKGRQAALQPKSATKNLLKNGKKRAT